MAARDSRGPGQKREGRMSVAELQKRWKASRYREKDMSPISNVRKW
jgi:hypothetical protein